MKVRIPLPKRFRVSLPFLSVDVAIGPEVRILLNKNVTMTRHKAAAQAVHAALMAAGVPHGRVVVLGGSPAQVAAMPHVVRDAGRTEVKPGTMTAGAELIR